MAYPVVTTYGDVLLNNVAAATRVTPLPPQLQAAVIKTSPTLPPTQQLPPPTGGGRTSHGPLP